MPPAPGPRFAVFTVSLPEWTPEEAVRILAELGYEGIEWRVTDEPPHDGAPGFWVGNRCTWPLSSFVDDAPRIRALTDSAGLVAANVGTYVRCTDTAAVAHAMRGAATLGARSLRVQVPRYDGREPFLPSRDRALRAFEEVVKLAAQHGVRALVELHFDTLLPSASAAAEFLGYFDPDCVGAIHDAGNLVLEGYERYRLGLEVLGPYLAHVHLKNARWQRTGTRADGSATWHASFAPLREGIVDVGELFDALRAVGYDGWISFEDFSTDRPLLERTRDNLEYARAVCQAVYA